MSDLDALRFQIAAARGLPPAAVQFLAGSTIVEVEESATAFQRLLSTHAGASEPEPAATENLLAAALAAKTARKRAIVQMFAGPSRKRDELGRYAGHAGFDGGPRGQAIPTASPVDAHNQVVTRLASLAQTFRGATF